MALRREVIAIPLVGSLDTKTDAKVVVPGNLLVCENGEFTKGGSLRKRAGHTEVLPALTSGDVITDGLGLAALGDGFILLGRQNAYVLDRNAGAWTTLGPYTPVTHRATEIARLPSEQTNPDLDSVNGVTVVAWEDTRGGVYCSAFDDATGAALVSDIALESDGTLPRVTRTGGALIVTWHNGSTDEIEARVFQTSNVQAGASAANISIAANANTSAQYDIVSGDNVAHLAYRQDAGVADDCQLVTINPAGTVVRAATAFAQVPNAGPAIGWDEAQNRVLVAQWTTAGNVGQVCSFDGSTLAAIAATVETVTNVVAVTVGPNTEGGASHWYQTTSDVQVFRYDEFMGTVGTLESIRRSVLTTAPWFDGFNNVAIVAYSGTATNLQTAYYMVRDDGIVIGRLLYGSAHLQNINFPHFKSLGGDQFAVALGFRRQVPVAVGAITGSAAATRTDKLSAVFEHMGIQRIDIDTAPKLTPVEIDNVLYTNGSWLWAIDGAGPPVEAQAPQFPDVVASNIVASAGSALDASASYSYRWYYERTDARGHRVRSLALTVTLTSSATDREFTHTLPTMPYTAHDGWSIVGYRTEGNSAGTLFYRVTDPDPANDTGDNRYVANDTGASTVTFIDALSDANLISREIDYMSRGEVEHLAFDGPGVIGEAGNRLWCVGGGENAGRPQFSLLRSDGSAIEANDGFVVTEFPEVGGRTTAVSHLNGIPVVFRERAIYAIEGDGPFNDRSVVSAYIVRQVSSDIGCIEPRSVLSTRDGVYFNSAKGKYILGADWQVRYIGEAVERYNAQDVTGVAIVPDTNQVVFLTSAGITLMFDYHYGKWSEYTNHEGSALAASESGFAYLRNSGSLFIRDGRDAATRVHTDASVPYSMRARTGPIRIADTIQGNWLVKKVLGIGEYKSPHELEVRVFRNREIWPNQIFRWKPDVAMGQTVWGDETVWGDPTSVWGGIPRSNEYGFDQKVKARKVSTVSIEFVDVMGSTPGASYEMTELGIELQELPGLARLPATRKI